MASENALSRMVRWELEIPGVNVNSSRLAKLRSD